MDAQVGDDFSWGPRSTGFAEWNRFAAVNDEFVPIHMDDDEGLRAGYSGAIAMGRLQWSYVHRVLRDWFPEGGRIVSVALQFRGPTLRGVPFHIRGRVTGAHEQEGERRLDVDIWIEDSDATVLAPGRATVALPAQR